MAGGGRNRRRSLATANEERAAAEAAASGAEQNEEGYGAFIERMRFVRAAEAERENAERDRARAAARQPPVDVDRSASPRAERATGEESERSTGTPRTDRPGEEETPRAPHGPDAVSVKLVGGRLQTFGKTEHQVAAGLRSRANWEVEDSPRHSFRRPVGSDARGRSQRVDGTASERRGAAGMPSALASAGSTSRARKDAYFTPHVGVDYSGEYWDDGSIDDVGRRLSGWDYVERKDPWVLRSKETIRARSIAAAGVWKWRLSTGAKPRPPSALTEFPGKSKLRRPPPERWFVTQGEHRAYVC